MARSKMIALDYEFIFSKDANLWNHVYEFEKDLADFFAANKLEAEVVTPLEGNGSHGIMLISKIETRVPTLINTKGVNLTNVRKSSTIVNRLTESIGKGRKK